MGGKGCEKTGGGLEKILDRFGEAGVSLPDMRLEIKW